MSSESEPSWLWELYGRSRRPRPRLPPGTRLDGRYVLGPALGAGGFGTVYAADDTRLRREVALKLAHPGAPRPAREREAQALREAQLGARVAPSWAVMVFDVRTLVRVELPAGADAVDLDPFAGASYLVAERLRGETLRARMEAAPLSVAQVARIGARAADALANAHAAGVAHGDLKPANLWLSEPAPDGAVRLLDFGLARAFSGAGSAASPKGGTPGYTPPERRGGGAACAAGDVWSLAVTLREAAAAAPADASRDALGRALEAALATSPAHRPSAAKLRDTLDGLAGASRAGPGRPRVRALLRGATVAGVLFVAAFALRGSSPAALGPPLRGGDEGAPAARGASGSADASAMGSAPMQPARPARRSAALHAEGRAAVERGDRTGALRAFHEAAHVQREALGPEAADTESELAFARTLEALHWEWLARRDHDEALAAAREMASRMAAARAAGDLDPRLRVQLARALKLEARVHEVDASSGAALRSFTQALALLHGMRDAAAQATRAKVLASIGNVELVRGRHGHARARYRAAIAATPHDGDTLARSPAARRTLLWMQLGAARVEREAGELGRAQQGLEQALALARRNVAGAHGLPGLYAIDLATVLYELADVEVGLGATEAARAHAHEAVALARGLADREPLRHAVLLAGALRALGTAAAREGSVHDAVEALERAVRALEPSLARSPGHQHLVVPFARTLVALGEAQRAAGFRQVAQATFARAEGVADRVATRDPEDRQAAGLRRRARAAQGVAGRARVPDAGAPLPDVEALSAARPARPRAAWPRP